jgi:Fanconi anemia group M protein
MLVSRVTGRSADKTYFDRFDDGIVSVCMPKIIADARESHWVVVSLKKLGSEVIERTISPADYVLSDNYAVERKEFGDFIGSVYSGRLFDQAERLAAAYENPFLVVEGPVAQGLMGLSNPLVFWGALAKVSAEWNISVIFTLNEEHTAMFLHSLARKLQEEKKRKIAVKYKPRTYTLSQRQLMAVQGLPHIGPGRAEKLLEMFGSVRRIFSASDKELMLVEGLGKKIVKDIKDLLDTKYPCLESLVK